MKNLLMTLAVIFTFGIASARDSTKISNSKNSSRTLHDTVKNHKKNDSKSATKKNDTVNYNKMTKSTKSSSTIITPP